MTVEFSENGAKLAAAVGYKPPADYRWTQEIAGVALAVKDVQQIVAGVRERVEAANLVFPDADLLIKRSVIGLLAGHLVLQGPPGTGKTTLARILAEAFRAQLEITTATAEWSTYDVLGGLRPTETSALMPTLGAVSSTVLRCAEQVRDSAQTSADSQPSTEDDQAVWLLIDEINRADIDKAVGPLYTVLSSTSPSHLQTTPLELWFELGHGNKIWVPARYRILATMNDVDTSFVNTISQGLTRRFQFVYVGVPVGEERIRAENQSCREQGVDWVKAQFADLQNVLAESIARREAQLQSASSAIESLIHFVRDPDGDVRWPLGTAQITDVWRSLLLALLVEGMDSTRTATVMLDEALADRVIPQAGTLDDEQLASLESWLKDNDLATSSHAVSHLRDTRSTI